MVSEKARQELVNLIKWARNRHLEDLQSLTVQKARGFEVSLRICSGTDSYFQFQQWWTSGSLNSSER